MNKYLRSTAYIETQYFFPFNFIVFFHCSIVPPFHLHFLRRAFFVCVCVGLRLFERFIDWINPLRQHGNEMKCRQKNSMRKKAWEDNGEIVDRKGCREKEIEKPQSVIKYSDFIPNDIKRNVRYNNNANVERIQVNRSNNMLSIRSP